MFSLKNFNKYITFFLLLILITVSSTVLAQVINENIKPQETKETTCVNISPKRPKNLAGFFTRGFCHVAGLNFAAAKIAEIAVKRQIKKTARGEFDVDIKPFSAFDLLAGKLKSLEVEAKNVEINQVYLSSIHAKSICDYIHIDYKAKPVKVLEPITVAFESIISQNDLSRTVSSQRYLNRISNVKLNGEKYQWATLIKPKARIENGRIKINAELHFSGMPQNVGVPVLIDSTLGIINNKVQMSDIKVSTSGIDVNITLSEYMLDKINPVFGSIKDLEIKGRKISVSNVAVKNNQINIKGSIWLPKNVETNTISSKS